MLVDQVVVEDVVQEGKRPPRRRNGARRSIDQRRILPGVDDRRRRIGIRHGAFPRHAPDGAGEQDQGGNDQEAGEKRVCLWRFFVPNCEGACHLGEDLRGGRLGRVGWEPESI